MKNRLKLKTKIILTLILALVLLVMSAIIYAIFETRGKITFEALFKVFEKGTYWLVLLIIYASLTVFILTNRRIQADKEVVKDNYGEMSRLMTKHDIRRSKDFVCSKYSDLGQVSDGTVLQAKRSGKNIKVIMTTEPRHSLIIGTSGSYKTTGFMNPTIQTLMKTKTKPSMIISDPKGELFDIHAKALKNNGYKVLVVDLISPYYSSHWNPFDVLTERVDKIKELKLSNNFDKEVQIQILRDEIFEFAKDLSDAICPLEKSNDMSWQKGAKSLINAIILAFCEDYEDELMPKHKVGFTSLYHTVFNNLSSEDDKLKKYLYECRSPLSKVKGMAMQVLESQDRTLSSYLSEVYKHTEWLSDTGILSMTSESDINLYNFDEEAIALFIKIPDEKKTRHRLVTLLITQMYKCLVEKSRRNKAQGKTDAATLLRTNYFLLDEFGNLPAFNDLDVIVSVARSRKMFFNMVIQSYEQLTNKYGKEVANIVKEQSAVKIFLGSDSSDTINEISTLCGKKLVANVNLNSSWRQNTESSATSTKEVPLIYPTELKNLNNADNFGNAVVLSFGHFAFKSKFTPSFKCADIYQLGGGDDERAVAKYFDELKFAYDINIKLKEIEAIEEDLKKLQKEMMEEQKAKSKKKTQKKVQTNEFDSLFETKLHALAQVLPELQGLIKCKNPMFKLQDLIDKATSMDLKFKLIELKKLYEKERGKVNE